MIERYRLKQAEKTSHVTVFTEASVRRYAAPPDRQIRYVQKLKRGLTLQLHVSYGGTKTWRVLFYDGKGKARTKALGRYPDLGVKAAREAAYDFDPKAATAATEAGSFKEVAEKWIKHYVDAKGLISKPEIERILKYYIYPEWERKSFFEIRRSDVNALLDQLVEKHGAPQADGVLATLRSIMNWFQTRDENYVSPIVKGMRRDRRKAKDRARSRILDDSEIRAVWQGCDGLGYYGALVRLLLLTAQREGKVVTMRWGDIKAGVWTIRTAPREKGTAGQLKLPQAALGIIEAQDRIVGNPHVLPATLGNGPFNGFSKKKAELDRKVPLPHWTLHDLRRTARSLMARIGVADNVAERVLGHAITGVEGTYNRHVYFEEKADTLQRLAAIVETIINPPDQTNVVPLPARA